MDPHWRTLGTGTGHNLAVRRDAHVASGTYAIREASDGAVVYVGESSTGNLWRTLLRHFQAPQTFKAAREVVFLGAPSKYEIALWITSRGHRPLPPLPNRKESKRIQRLRAAGIPFTTESDQAALDAQAEWIAMFLADGHGDTLKNKDDGKAAAEPDDDDAAEPEGEVDTSFEFNPGNPPALGPNVAAEKRAENRTPDLWTGRTKLEDGGKGARRDWKGEAERAARELAECRRGAPQAAAPAPLEVEEIPAPVVPPAVRPEGYGETDGRGQASMFKRNPVPVAASAASEEFIFWAARIGRDVFIRQDDNNYSIVDDGRTIAWHIRDKETADWLLDALRTARADASIHGKVSELVGPPPVPRGDWAFSTLLSGSGTVFRKTDEDDIADVCTTDRGSRALFIAQLANLGWAFAAEMDAGRAAEHARRAVSPTHALHVGDVVKYGKRNATIAKLLPRDVVRIVVGKDEIDVDARAVMKPPPPPPPPPKTPRAPRPTKGGKRQFALAAPPADPRWGPAVEKKAMILVAVAVDHRGHEVWRHEGYSVHALRDDADAQAPNAASVTIRADRLSDGTVTGIGNGKAVAWRERGKWIHDGLPVPDDRAVLRLIDDGYGHALAVDSMDLGTLSVAERLSESGLVRRTPARGSWPDRYVVTEKGSHHMGTFRGADPRFRERSREASESAQRLSARAAAKVAEARPTVIVETKGKHAGQLRMFNPDRGPVGRLTELGVLRELGTKGEILAWALRDAPVLAYDSAKKPRLFIVYPGKVVRGANRAELREYARTHWGTKGRGTLRNGGRAVGPWKSLGTGTVITYATKKGGDKTVVFYVHEWGETGGILRKKFTPPTIVVHDCKACGPRCAARGSLAIVGGSYTVNERGIVG